MPVSEVGLVFSIYFVGVCCGCLILGSVITSIGARFMYITGMFVRGSADIIFGFLIFAPDGTPFIVLCFIVRLVESLGSAAFMTAMFAIVAKEYPARFASISGWLWACNAIGLMAGPPLGGLLYDIGGFTFPFLVLGGFMLRITFISIFCMPPFKYKPTDAEKKAVKKEWKFSLLKNPGILLNLLCAMLEYGPICFIEISLEMLLKPFNLSAGMVGLVFICQMAAYAIFSTVIGHINNTIFHPRLQEALGCLIYGVGYMFLAPIPLFNFEANIWSICVCLAAVGVGASVVNCAAFKDNIDQVLADGHPDTFETHGVLSGLYICGITTGAFLGTFLGSSISELYGFPVASMVMTFLIWSVGVLVVAYKVFEGKIQQYRRYKRHITDTALDSREQCTESTPILINKNRAAMGNE